ncbi:hypothetical protein [Nonomuraea sp. NPDC005650]|uniref:hypothetical protein n=1 Tax=Nonomuraea sp. NPDC005650 TaxID=3157045 RepID=UPI0033A6DCBD
MAEFGADRHEWEWAEGLEQGWALFGMPSRSRCSEAALKDGLVDESVTQRSATAWFGRVRARRLHRSGMDDVELSSEAPHLDH